jgi:hypothetical protein
MLLAACGGLETPIATVRGRIVGASPGAYAYPLGRPDLKVTPVVGVDGVADFVLEAVPTGVGALVLYDGADRAEQVPVALVGGAEARVGDRFGAGSGMPEPARMPLAGAILAAAIADGGAVPSAPRFTADGTDHEGAGSDPGSTGVATLYPLPPGAFTVTASLPGFHERRVAVQVLPGATAGAQVWFEIDGAAAARGCAASEDGCENDLRCNPVDGRCYDCVSASDCDSEETCDAATGLCRPLSGVAGETCSACAADSECTSGVCVRNDGDLGYCSEACSATCPAGFECRADGRCWAPTGCDHWLQTMGRTCLNDDPCTESLVGGRCERPGAGIGYCTAPCMDLNDCQIGNGTAATFVCAPGGYCTPP